MKYRIEIEVRRRWAPYELTTKQFCDLIHDMCGALEQELLSFTFHAVEARELPGDGK